ncbi:MAG: alpha/beta hydrolase, partial [Oscillospiraceae bacterium]|nr:alpha/beta hydrolase [Oscillospiraceae bacterium]
GSFIVRLAAVRDKHDKLIGLGTDGPRSEYIISQYYLSLLKAVKGERYISPMSKKLAFGKYNERFGNDDPLNWLTKNADVRDAYRADRLCTYDFTTGAYLDLVKLLRRCNTKKWAESLNKNKPVLLMSGTDDPVGHYGAGVRKVNDMLRDAGVPVTMKLYENCRHEVINETCYDDALNDMLKFVND